MTVVLSDPKKRAVLVAYEGEEEWIPKSLIEGDEYEDAKKGDEIDLDIPLWKAAEMGWT